MSLRTPIAGCYHAPYSYCIRCESVPLASEAESIALLSMHGAKLGRSGRHRMTLSLIFLHADELLAGGVLDKLVPAVLSMQRSRCAGLRIR